MLHSNEEQEAVKWAQVVQIWFMVVVNEVKDLLRQIRVTYHLELN